MCLSSTLPWHGNIVSEIFWINNIITKYVRSLPTKLLGQILGTSAKPPIYFQLIKYLSPSGGQNYSYQIQEDYEIWIYCNYFMPPLFFHLAVISKSASLKLEVWVTHFLKIWLHLVRLLSVSCSFRVHATQFIPSH